MSSDLSAQYDKIYKYCYFKTGDALLSEDLTQETFLRFYKTSKYTEQGKVMAYLYTIAANLCRDSFRYRKAPCESLDKTIKIAAPQEDTDTLLALRQAVNLLDEEEKEVIILVVINGQTLSEAARITGVSRFTLYRREKRALKKLRNILGGDFYG